MQLLIKAECLQHTGSFKIRGATNRLARLSPDERARGVVAFSSGNHAQGVARAARVMGIDAVIVMPSDAPAVKREGVLADGARIVAYDRFTESREAIAADISAREGRVVVPSYDDADIIAGQGTAGLEIAQQAAALGASLDHLVCCVGGGGLIAGVGLAMAALSPRTRVWGAEPEGFDDHAVSLARGEVTPHDGKARSICDALLSPAPGEMTFALNRRQLSGVMVVSDDQVRSAMRAAFRQLKLVVEPGGAAALAAVMHQAPRDWAGQTVAVLLTGGNVDPAQFADVISSSR